MKIINKHTILSILCLILLVLANLHCLPQPITLPITPPAPSKPTPQDTTPPETRISTAPDMTINYNEVTFEWTGSDDTTPTADLTYAYYLESYDTSYSPFSANTTKTYTDLPDGSYTFYVKSRDSAGNVDPTPASVEFTIATTPPEEPEVIIPIASTLLIVPGSNVNHIVVAYDNTVYAIDSPNAKLYKSGHSGIGWTDISNRLGAGGPWGGLAIAPDNPKIVAVTTNAGAEVYVSTDGGARFSGTGLSGMLGGGERVTCLAISPGYGRWDIAVGTATGGGNGRILVNTVSGFPSGWQDMSTGATGWSNADIFTIKYSPGFAADGTMLAIAATAPPTDDTYLYIGLRDLGGSTTIWNSSSGYPVEICQSGQDTPGTPLTYADIALPSDYSGSLPTHRHVYACWSDNSPVATIAGNVNGDVYRLDDTVCYRLLVRSDIICSLAHYGMFSRGKLLAGAARASITAITKGPQTYYTSNPQSTSPTWQNSQKPPTGPAQARVAWSPDGKVAYCGTSAAGIGSHDQSAFSISTNDGSTWNQTGLIDP